MITLREMLANASEDVERLCKEPPYYFEGGFYGIGGNGTEFIVPYFTDDIELMSNCAKAVLEKERAIRYLFVHFALASHAEHGGPFDTPRRAVAFYGEDVSGEYVVAIRPITETEDSGAMILAPLEIISDKASPKQFDAPFVGLLPRARDQRLH